MTFILKPTSCDDDISNYDVILNKPHTVGEFVDMILKEKTDEWGYIHIIVDPFDIFSPKTLHCKYRYGSLITNPLPANILTKSIQSINASSHMSCVDYCIIPDGNRSG